MGHGYLKFSKKAVLSLFLCFPIMMSGCLPPRTELPTKLVGTMYSKELASYLPSGLYEWRQVGTADYLHQMGTVDIFESSATLVHQIKGEVADLSAGEAQTDFFTEIHYTVTEDRLIQEKKGPMLIDSEALELTILKLPVNKGTTWTEEVKREDGSSLKLKSTIIEVEGPEGSKKATIVVKEEGGPYHETRKIQQGIGIVSFTKLMTMEGESFEVGYHLDEVKEESADSIGSGAAATSAVSGEAGSGVQADIDGVKDAIMGFDAAWIEFVNSGKEDIFRYLVKNGTAYKLIGNFKRDGSRQKFLEVSINKVEVLDDRASAWVVERIQLSKNEHERELVYHWVYYLKKMDGKWLIDAYEQDK